MARHKVEQVIVAEQWGQRNAAGTFVPGNSLGTINAFQQTTFHSPRLNTNGLSDVFSGDLVVINYTDRKNFLFTGVATAPNPNPDYPNQRGYFPNHYAIQFATYDPFLGARMSQKIAYDRINRIWGRPFTLRNPQISVFHLAYNVPGPGNPIITYKGQSAVVVVNVQKTNPEWDKHSFMAQTYVGGVVTTNALGTPNTSIPASNSDIQKAHFDMLEQILLADIKLGGNQNPNGLYFDAQASRTLSASSGYTAIYLVGNLRPVFAFDRYAEMRANIHDVSCVAGFQNLIYEESFTPAGLAGSYSASRAYLCRNFLAPSDGSGYPDQVTWHERKVVGQMGQMSHFHYPNTDNFLTRTDRFYSAVHIEFYENISQVGENGDKNLHKELTIYMPVVQKRATTAPITSADVDWRTQYTYTILNSSGSFLEILKPYNGTFNIPVNYTLSNLLFGGPLVVHPTIQANMVAGNADLTDFSADTSLINPVLVGPTVGGSVNQDSTALTTNQGAFFSGSNSPLLTGAPIIAPGPDLGNDFISNMNLALNT